MGLSLHFIDFETSTVALPFTAGRKPYEQVAFQFSHHKYNEDGTIDTKPVHQQYTRIPNFILRELQSAIGNDSSIFKFATQKTRL
jgi:hypothetical protein